MSAKEYAEGVAMFRRVTADSKADPEETALVLEVLLEEYLLQDYVAAVDHLRRLRQEIIDAPTKH